MTKISIIDQIENMQHQEAEIKAKRITLAKGALERIPSYIYLYYDHYTDMPTIGISNEDIFEATKSLMQEVDESMFNGIRYLANKSLTEYETTEAIHLADMLLHTKGE